MVFKHDALHHRKPRSLGGGDDSRNVVRVKRKDHLAWHRLFNGWCPEDIAEAINDTWLDPNYRFIATKVR